MVFSVVVNNDKRWYTAKLLVSLEIPRGNFPYEKIDIETTGEGEGGVLFSMAYWDVPLYRVWFWTPLP